MLRLLKHILKNMYFSEIAIHNIHTNMVLVYNIFIHTVASNNIHNNPIMRILNRFNVKATKRPPSFVDLSNKRKA